MNELQKLWSIYFAQVVAMRLHPGYRNPLDLAECAELADKMLGLTKLHHEDICPSDQQPS